MFFRTPESIARLKDAPKQNGEGNCWPALLCTFEFGNRVSLEELAIKLGTTAKNGTDTSRVIEFLGSPWYAEANCTSDRLIKAMTSLPKQVRIYTTVFCGRYTEAFPQLKKDKFEAHVVAPLQILLDDDGYPWVQFYDPDSYRGGVLQMPLGLWWYWWHDGPGSKTGPNREISSAEIDGNFKRFMLVTGVDRRTVHELIGKPGGSGWSRTIVTNLNAASC